MQAGESRSSSREGTDEEFDPARQAQYALESERLHEGLATEALMIALIQSGSETADPLDLAPTDGDRRLLASILMHEEEELTADTVEGAVRALRRITLRRRLEDTQRQLLRTGISMGEKQALLQEKLRLKRALMDPSLADAAGQAS
jgi:hypothetical protein